MIFECYSRKNKSLTRVCVLVEWNVLVGTTGVIVLVPTLSLSMYVCTDTL